MRTSGTRRALLRLTTSCALALAVTGCSLADLIGKPIGTKIGTEIGKAAPVNAVTEHQFKGGDVCDVLAKLGYPLRLTEHQIVTTDGKVLRILLDTNDTVRACP